MRKVSIIAISNLPQAVSTECNTKKATCSLLDNTHIYIGTLCMTIQVDSNYTGKLYTDNRMRLLGATKINVTKIPELFQLKNKTSLGI